MPEPDLLTADEAAKLLRIGRRTFDGHVARGDIAYIAVGLGLQRVRKRFDPEDIARFRESQRRVERPRELTRNRRHASAAAEWKIVDFKAVLEERRAERRADREAAQRAAQEAARKIVRDRSQRGPLTGLKAPRPKARKPPSSSPAS